MHRFAIGFLVVVVAATAFFVVASIRGCAEKDAFMLADGPVEFVVHRAPAVTLDSTASRGVRQAFRNAKRSIISQRLLCLPRGHFQIDGREYYLALSGGAWRELPDGGMELFHHPLLENLNGATERLADRDQPQVLRDYLVERLERLTK